MKMLLKARHKDESWERSLDQKLDFHIQRIRFGPPFNLSGTRTELDAWNRLPGGRTGADHQRFSRPPCCVDTAKQKHKAAAGSLCCSALLWRRGRLPHWRAASSAWEQHKHGRDLQRVSVLGENRFSIRTGAILVVFTFNWPQITHSFNSCWVFYKQSFQLFLWKSMLKRR